MHCLLKTILVKKKNFEIPYIFQFLLFCAIRSQNNKFGIVFSLQFGVILTNKQAKKYWQLENKIRIKEVFKKIY